MYQPFVYQPHHDDHKGWAAGAGHHAKLLVPNTVCFLTKEMDHRQIAGFVPSGHLLHLLGLPCVGNDFPFFLACCWTITACDGP